jgi:hypothetical protein
VFAIILLIFVIVRVIVSGTIGRSGNNPALSKAKPSKRRLVKDRWFYEPIPAVQSVPVPQVDEDWELYYPPWMTHLHPTMWEHMQKDSTQAKLRQQETKQEMTKELLTLYGHICSRDDER